MGTIDTLPSDVKPLADSFRTVHYGDISYKRARDCVYAAIGYDYVDSVSLLDADVSYYCDTRSLWSGALGVYWTPAPFYRDAAIVAVRQLIAEGRAYGDHPLLYRAGLGSRGCAGRICSMVEVDDRSIEQQIRAIDAIEALVGPTYSTVVMSGDGRPSARAAIEAVRTTTHRIEHVEGKSLHVYASHPEIVPDDLAAEIHRYHVAILGGDPSIGDVARRMRRPSTIATEYTTDGALRARVQTTLRAEPIIIPATEYLDRLRRVASHYGIDVEQSYTEAVQAHRASRSIGAGGSADTVDQGWVDPRTIVRDSTGREIRLCDLAARIPVGGSEQVYARPDNVRTPSATAYRDDEWISVYDHRTRERWYTSVTTPRSTRIDVNTPPVYIYKEGGVDIDSAVESEDDLDPPHEWCPDLPTPEEAQVVYLTLAIGHGKTTAMVRALKRLGDETTVLSISPTRGLTYKHITDLGIETHYQDVEGLIDAHRVEVCGPSLCRVAPRPGGVVILDEAEANMAMLHNRRAMTHNGVDRRGVTWRVLRAHLLATIRAGGQVWIADAHISDATRRDIARLLAGEDYTSVELGHSDGYRPLRGQIIDDCMWEGQVIDRIISDVEARTPMTIYCSRKIDVQAYAHLVRKAGGDDYRVLEIHSESDEDARKTLLDATGAGSQYDCIIYNLAAGQGVSWDMDGWRSYSIIREVRGIGWHDMRQAIGRLRYPTDKTRTIWIEPHRQTYETCIETLRSQVRSKIDRVCGYIHDWYIDADGTPRLIEIDDSQTESYIDRLHISHVRAQDADRKLLDSLRGEGARVREIAPEPHLQDRYEALQGLIREAMQEIDQAKVDAAVAAPVVTSARIREIRAKHYPTQEERATLAKYTSVNRWGRGGESETMIRDTLKRGSRNTKAWRLGNLIATLSDPDSLAAVRGRVYRSGLTKASRADAPMLSKVQLDGTELESRCVASILDALDIDLGAMVEVLHPHGDRTNRSTGEFGPHEVVIGDDHPLMTWTYHHRLDVLDTWWPRVCEVQHTYPANAILGLQDPREITDHKGAVKWIGSVLSWVGIPRSNRRPTIAGQRVSVYRIDVQRMIADAEIKRRQLSKASGVEVETVDEMYPQVDVTQVLDAILDGIGPDVEPEPIAVVDLHDDAETSTEVEPVEPETTWTTAEGTPIYEIPAPVWDVQDGTVLQLSPDGRRGVYLRSDGIVTYVLPRAEHDAWMRQLADRASQVDDETLVEHWHRYAEERGVEVEWREAV